MNYYKHKKMARTNNVQNRNKSVPIVSFLFNYFATENMKKTC